MSDILDTLHGARPGRCNVQPGPANSAPHTATLRATTSLKAASLRVLARTQGCTVPATMPPNSVHPMAIAARAGVAPEDTLAAMLAEVNGLLARLTRSASLQNAEVIAVLESCAGPISELLRCVQAVAARVPRAMRPTEVGQLPHAGSQPRPLLPRDAGRSQLP